jgi:hypothetical protein
MAQRKLELRERLAGMAAQQSELELQVTRVEARLLHACKSREERAQVENVAQQKEVENLKENTTENLVITNKFLSLKYNRLLIFFL